MPLPADIAAKNSADLVAVTIVRSAAPRQQRPELRAVHPLGKSPVIEDNGRVVSESGAIVEHILRGVDGGLMVAHSGPEKR